MLKQVLSTQATALLAASGILVAAGILSHPSDADTRRARISAMSRQQVGQAQPGMADKPMIRIFVHNEDIYPDIIRARPGVLRIRAENETLSDVSLVIERSESGKPGQRFGNVKTTRQGKRAEQEVGLGVGEYVYYDEARPDVRGRLIVEPD
jgi:hypothetical protein